MTNQELKKEIARLQSENQVLKQVISETQKTLSSIDDYVSNIVMDVKNPFTISSGPNSSGAGSKL
tara:strand:+ start:418 stop:612 length:195 start_codon:yes stop_codon:yes gene_type:complete